MRREASHQLQRLDRPHADADESLRDQVDDEGKMPDTVDKEPGLDVRITDRDLRLYGHTEGCPKCDDLTRGNKKTGRNHSQECRLRMYLSWKENEDYKYTRVRHLLETDDDGQVDLKDAPRGIPPTPKIDVEQDEGRSGVWDPSYHEGDWDFEDPLVEENSAMDVAMDEDELAATYTMEDEDTSPPKDSDSMMDYLISAGVAPVVALDVFPLA